MASGVDVVVVKTPFEDFAIRVRRPGPARSSDELELARRAARAFRFGIETADPRVARAARELLRMLDHGSFGFGAEPERGDGASLGSRSARALGVRRPVEFALDRVAERLERELLAGRLVVERNPIASLTDNRPFDVPELPPLPPAPRSAGTHSFEVRFVDEVGQAISGIDAEFTADGAQTRPTNAAGIAFLDGVQASSANVALLDPVALGKVLDPRWENLRPGTPPKESNTREVVFDGAELGPFDLKAEVPNTIVIRPPPGKLFVELWDKTGRVRHANRSYQISGPQSFEGTTDDEGLLLHEDVFPGDYQLALTLESFDEGDPDRAVSVVEGPLVVLAPADAAPQVRLLGAVPRSVLARLHLFFNTNKAFLLPTALPSVRMLRRLYLENAPCKLLVVGHADTRASTAYNDELSLERAEATIAYLKDDVDGWFKFYGQDIESKKRWGKTEDHLMIVSMPGFAEKPKGEDPTSWYQRTRGLEVDGIAGKNTRHALIAEYMALDGASLSDSLGEIEAVAHGCGEHFPLDDSGDDLDEAPTDDKRDPIDRRVELFFFDAEFGITPPPPGKNSKPGSAEYPLWRKRVVETLELEAGDPDAPEVAFVELSDALFRTNSAVVLPEGEAPSENPEAHQSLTSVSGFALLLRLNEERPGKKLLVAGHTDTSASEAFNQELSEERAACALALLLGDRERFKSLCEKRHKVSDYKQILSWVSRKFPGFSCAPGKIDDNLATAAGPVRQFQEAYNENRVSLGITQSAIDVDGSVGKQTWGAFFDMYELALADELGETPEGVAELRKLLVFVDDQRRALGFGEHFPIEELGVDNFRSQTNRRVELLLFDSGEEPDLVHAQDDPQTSELYLPGFYQRSPLPLRPGGAKPHMSLTVLLFRPGGTRSGVVYELSNDEGFSQRLSDAAPSTEVADTLELRFVDVPMTSPLTLEQVVAGGSISILAKVPPTATFGDTPNRFFVTELDSKPEPSERFFSYDVQEALS